MKSFLTVRWYQFILLCVFALQHNITTRPALERGPLVPLSSHGAIASSTTLSKELSEIQTAEHPVAKERIKKQNPLTVAVVSDVGLHLNT